MVIIDILIFPFFLGCMTGSPTHSKKHRDPSPEISVTPKKFRIGKSEEEITEQSTEDSHSPDKKKKKKKKKRKRKTEKE